MSEKSVHTCELGIRKDRRKICIISQLKLMVMEPSQEIPTYSLYLVNLLKLHLSQWHIVAKRMEQ